MKSQNRENGLENTQGVEYIKNESVELFLTYCGKQMIEDEYQAEIDKRSDYILCVLINGRGSLHANNQSYKLKENSVILLLPGMKGKFEIEAFADCSCTWIGFSGVKAEECIRNLGFSQNRLIQTLKNAEHFSNYVELMQEHCEMTFAKELRRNGLLKLFFADLIEMREKYEQDVELDVPYEVETPKYIRNTISYIAENYASNIRINELADLIGVNRSYLTSSFKKATGYSPKEYLLSLRMENAKHMLEQTNLPINSIASSVGYTDQLAFSRMFKRYSGMSPRAYRENCK